MKRADRITTHVLIGAAAAVLAIQSPDPQLKPIASTVAVLAGLSTVGEAHRPGNK